MKSMKGRVPRHFHVLLLFFLQFGETCLLLNKNIQYIFTQNGNYLKKKNSWVILDWFFQPNYTKKIRCIFNKFMYSSYVVKLQLSIFLCQNLWDKFYLYLLIRLINIFKLNTLTYHSNIIFFLIYLITI